MILHRHNRLKYLFFFTILFFSVSCEKEADITFNHVDSQVVIISNFTPDEPFSLNISRSKVINSNVTEQSLESADIQICRGENCEVLEPKTGNDNLNELGFLTRDFQPEVGVQYSLKVNVEGMESMVSAEAITPALVPLSHVAVGAITEIPLEDDPEDEKQYDVRVSLQFDDPSGVDNYYQINFYQELISNDGNIITAIDSSGIEDFISIDADLVNLRNVSDNGILISDRQFDGMTRDLLFRPTFKFNPLNQQPINLKVELKSVSKAYFDYYSSVFKQVSQGSDPFTQPVEVISNIKNGHGIFAGYSKDEIKREIQF